MKDTIAESFADIEDPRVLGRVLHPAVNIIYISIAAVLCGFRGWEDIEDFGEDLSAKRARNAAFNFDTLCKLALNILKNDGYDHGKKKISIRRKMNKAVLNREYLAHLLSLL